MQDQTYWPTDPAEAFELAKLDASNIPSLGRDYPISYHIRFREPRTKRIWNSDFFFSYEKAPSFLYPSPKFALSSKAYLVITSYSPKYYQTQFRLPITPFQGGFKISLPRSGYNRMTVTVSKKISQPRKRKIQQGARVQLLRTSPDVFYRTFPYHKYVNGVNTSNSTDTYETYHREWINNNTPNFKHLAAIHQLPVNGYGMYQRTIRDYGLQRKQETFSQHLTELELSSYQRVIGGTYGPTIPNCQHLDKDELSDKALSRFINPKDGGGLGMINITQDIVTGRQTTSMISNNLSKITSSILALKKGNISSAVGALFGNAKPVFQNAKGGPSKVKDLASNWLELQYGWKPLLNDIRESMDLIPRYNNPNYGLVSAKSSAKKKSVVQIILKEDRTGADRIGYYDVETITQVKLGMRYYMGNHHQAFLAQIGFTSPINLAWELLPYSFVVDWCLPIGPWLESFSAFDGLEFYDGYKTIFTTQNTSYKVDYSGTGLLGPNYTDYEWRLKGRLTSSAVRFERERITSFPHLNFPSFKPPFSVEHSLNALALLRSAFK